MKLNKYEIDFICIDDYIKKFNVYTKTLKHPNFNLKFHLLKNIIFFDITSNLCGQILMPELKHHNNIYIFEESFAYSHTNEEKLSILSKLLIEQNLTELDVAVPLSHVWGYNFYHFTFESLIKLLILEKLEYNGKYIVPNQKFVNEYLEMFNIDKKRICYSDRPYFVKNMFISERINGYMLKNRLDLVKLLREEIFNAIGVNTNNSRNNQHNLYIKRIGSRKIANEEEVLDILKKYDFDVLIPEEHSVRTQFQKMHGVKFSAMAHGANCTLVLAQDFNSKYIEFFNNNYVNYHVLSLIKYLNLDYTPLVNNLTNSQDKETNSQTDNITVPIDVLKIIIENYFKKKI